MPQLIPWQGEPKSARLLVVFSGTRAQFRDGLSAWLRHRGSLDLFGAPLSPHTTLPWPAGKETWVLSVATLPEYGMLGWWLCRAPEWSVFYQPDNGDGDHTQDYAELGGCFRPWGSTLAGREPDFIRPAVLWHASGKLQLPERLGNVFEEFDAKEALNFAARAAAAAKSVGGSAPVTDRFELGLADAVNRGVSNPRSELDRLRRKIHEMEEQAATLDWLARDQAPDAFLWMYLERDSPLVGVGTHWDLRDWFLSASAEAVAEFTHARIDMAGLGKLHILKPEELSRPVRCAPPKPSFRLRLDRAWRREGWNVFVPEGLELRPAPPLRNPHVVDLLQKALWQDCDPGADTLLLVRYAKQDFRFSVPEQEFQKLSTRVDELNRHVALETLRHNPAGPNPMELILKSIHDQLDARLRAHTACMTTLLADAWKMQRDGIDAERVRVTNAETNMSTIKASSKEIEDLHLKILALGKEEWEVWTKVVSGILQADRGLLPPERKDLRDWLQRLDQLRADMAGWWRPGRDQAAAPDCAKQLSGLAKDIPR